MIKVRVIPILTFNGFALVKTKNFTNPRMLGNPVQSAKVFNSRGVDELVFLDIMATKQKRKINLPLTKRVIDECFMPVAIGGGISTLEDIYSLLKIGADKVVIKSAAIESPLFIKEASNVFGSQCITIAIDVERINNEYRIKNDFGLNINVFEFVLQIQKLGAGEIILTSVDCDGTMNGFDINLYNEVIRFCNVPVVFSGGGGSLNDFRMLFQQTDCMAVGAASIFSYTQHTPLDIKRTINSVGRLVRLN